MKYIDIRTIGPDTFQVWLGKDGTETVVMADRDTGKLDFNHRAVGLRVKKNYRPPALTPGAFTKEEAIRIAHQIGRYFFNLGDIVHSYTTVDGLVNPSFFDI
jgi:hypothetical protein